MILEAKFLTTVSHVPPRSRSPRLAQVADSAAIEIEEVDEADMPVVARVAVSSVDGSPSNIRISAEGAFYRETGIDLRGIEAALKDVAPFTADANLLLAISSLKLDAEDRIDGGIDPGELATGRVVEDNRDRIVEMLRQRAVHLRVCSGHLMVECPEPCWRQVTGHVYAAVFPLAFDFDRAPAGFVRADRLAEVSERRHGKPPSLVGSIEVLDPGVFRMPVAERVLRDSVDQSVRRLAEMIRNGIETATVERFVFYAGCRDAVSPVPPGTADDRIEEVARIILEAHPEMLGGQLAAALEDRVAERSTEVPSLRPG